MKIVFAFLSFALFNLQTVSTVLSDQPAARQKDCLSTGWPHETSDLMPDPSLHYGRLENGFRYVLKANSEPRDRVSIFLNVEAGSLFEEESQRGLAHYLEHMLFNGSTHFQPGELIDYFQSIGMSFGGDTNAYTTYTDTVYKIILPGGSMEELDQGFLVMSDYADGALLLDRQIERERGVILAEKTARDSVSYRSHLARTSFLMGGTLLPERQPIGSEEVLRTAKRDQLKSFYDRWYRPDNMILTVVGDFDIDSARELISKHFSDLNLTEGAICPDFGRVEHSGVETYYHHEPEMGATEIFIETLTNQEPTDDSLALQTRQIHRYMATMIINQRLDKLEEDVATPFLSAAYYDSMLLDRFHIAGIRARTQKEQWRQGLAGLDETLRQAILYGVTEREIARAKNDLHAELEKALLGAETRDSERLASQILGSLNANRVLLSPEQEFELFDPVIDEVSVEDINLAIRQSWSQDTRLVQVIGDGEIDGDDKPLVLKQYYLGLARQTPEPFAEDAGASFPYLPVPTKLVKAGSRTDLADIEAVRFNFPNGFILNVKKTDYKQNQVLAALHFGSGRRSLPAKGMDLLASAVLNGSGTGTLKNSQLAEALAGRSVVSRFQVEEESFVIEGSAVAAETELLLQLLYSRLVDPGFRDDVYQIAMQDFESMYRQLEHSVEGSAHLYLDSFFTGDAPGSGFASWEQFQAINLEKIADWLSPYFAGAPLELSIVGDIDIEQVQRLAEIYFSTLAPRNYQTFSHPQADFPAGERFDIAVDSIVDKALIRFGWLTDDYWDIQRTRRLHVLAAVFEERLRRVIREELGKSYSPAAYSAASRIYPGYGAIYGEVIVDRESIQTTIQAIEEIGESLSNKPIDELELSRARDPIVTSLKDSFRTNGYWLHSVLSLSSRHEDQLHWPTSLISDFSAVSPEEINQLARSYIEDERRAVAVVSSSAGAQKNESAPAQ